ncbi:hypothetical protein HPB51_005484 [Rhipicephalus microplus]|uniref:Uncharacterized protein n=1 Tax=Rhipicephalus microplus TaxID=6941 RepID=A0A9J6EXP7_RHIMP|nr:hypothetical protein HPB51_005484 [Rhipicephalus microplus]
MVLKISAKSDTTVDELQRFCMENMGIKEKPATKMNDEHVLDYVRQTMEFKAGRYQVRLRWRENVTLDDKNTIAEKRLIQAPPPTPPPIPHSDSSIKPLSLLCTFGYTTSYQTKYPPDGVCDYIFYDSMYKHERNTLLGTWGEDVLSMLYKASKTDRTKTQFGVGFAFEHRLRLLQDLANTSFRNFWDHSVFHFGILDCPAHGTTQADMNEVFQALKALDNRVQKTRASGNDSYIVLGAVSHTSAWNTYFRDRFSGFFKPDLFISLGHQVRGDPQRSSCVATPPTILDKPEGLADAHDLYDAVRALAYVASQAGGPRLSLSVSMAGRWSKLLPTSRVEIFSACEKGTPSWRFFGSYTEVCNRPPFSTNLLHEAQRYAMRAFDPMTRRMLVFDDEQSLCQKLCLAKVNHTDVPFGVAVYDLDYEDTENTCSNLNSMGPYSRFEVVALAWGTDEARDVAECFSVVVAALERDPSLASLRKVLW